MLTAFSAGVHGIPAQRCLDNSAVSDALNHLASQGRLSDLQKIARATSDSWRKKYLDMLAAENPDDSRWDDWRSYRRAELSYAN
jgi:hypothetical protein